MNAGTASPTTVFRFQPDTLERLKHLQNPAKPEVKRRGRDDAKPVAAGTVRAYTSKQQEWRDFCDEKEYDDRYLVYEDKLMVFLLNCVLNRGLKRHKRAGSDQDDTVKLSKNTVRAYVSAIVNLYEEQRESGINLHAHPRGETLKALLDSLAETEDPEHRRRKSAKSSTPPAQRPIDLADNMDSLAQVEDMVDSRGYDMGRVLDTSGVDTHHDLLSPIGVVSRNTTDPQLVMKQPKKRSLRRKTSGLEASKDSLHSLAPELYEQMATLIRTVQKMEMSLTSTIRDQGYQISQLKQQIEMLTGNRESMHASSGGDVGAFTHLHHTAQYGAPASNSNAFR